MVYCGKPSKGCGACRARKVKCDQATPSCQRCIKAKRTCPGYRDQLSLLFRDESSSVAKRAKSNETCVSLTPGTPSSFTTVTTTSPPSSWHDHANSPTDYGLIQISARNSPLAETSYSGNYDNYDQFIDVENFSILPAFTDRRQQAICYCLHSFAWLNSGLIKGLDYDADILSTASMAQKAMMKGILAVGLANLSRTGARSQSMNIEAQQEYQKALKYTNMAISHPKQATDDATLTAILCMSLFEILTSKRPEKVESFIQHTRGAVALLEMRGEKQIFEAQYLHMFEFMRSEIIVSCIMRHYPVPPTLLAISEQVAMLPNTAFSSRVSHQISVLVCRINELRIESRHEKNSMDFDYVVIGRASALDSELEKLLNTLPPEYAPEVHTLAPGQYFEHSTLRVRLTPLNGVYHDYQSFLSCSIRNISRYGRIYANELMLNRLERMTLQPDFVLTPAFKETCQRLCNVSRQLAQDICATTPFLCGFLGDQRQLGKSPFLTNPAGGLALLFPLWTAVVVDGHGSATCQWIENTFDIIGRELGIDQALALQQLTFFEKGMTRFVDRL